MEIEELQQKVWNMDCRKFLRMIPDESLDSVVTDPPYCLGFMGKKWDSSGITYDIRVWKLLFKKLKHGAHLLAFSSTRTYHRLACVIEDAGFEIRDKIDWIYGQGFPKGLNVSKAIDEHLGHIKTADDYFHVPTSYEAQYWNGWNSQLKPAHEPIALVRKPLEKGLTIAENVLKHGVGALNVGECRISVNPDVDDMITKTTRKERASATWRDGSGFKNEANQMTGVLPSGRYPANIILTHHPHCVQIQEGTTEVSVKEREAIATTKHGIYTAGWVRNPNEYSFDDGVPELWVCHQDCPVRMMNEQSGIKKGISKEIRISKSSGYSIDANDKRAMGNRKTPLERSDIIIYGDCGGAARFFYCPKSSIRERTLGLESFNKHITVKPINLMRYLIRLVTPFRGITIDPFLGSGTTSIAAEKEHTRWLGCDNNSEYCDIARARIKAWRDVDD